MPGWLIPAISAIGSIFSGAASGSANRRENQNRQTLNQNQLIAQLYGINQNARMNARQLASGERGRNAGLDLDRRQHQQDQRRFNLAAPSARASQSVRGSILANAQPVSLSGLPSEVSSRMPRISGGLSPANFTPETRQLGQELTRHALMSQLAGDQIDEFDPLESTDFEGAVMDQPRMGGYQRPGLLENILGGLGLGMSAVGAAGGVIPGRPRRPRPSDADIYEGEDV